MNQKDQGYTQFVKTITRFPKRKKLVPKTRDFKQLFFFNGKQILFLYTNCFRPKQTAFKEMALRHYEGEGLRKNSCLSPATLYYKSPIRVICRMSFIFPLKRNNISLFFGRLPIVGT